LNKKGWLLCFLLIGILVVLAGCARSEPTPAPATAAVETVEAVEAVQSEFALVDTAWEAESFGGLDDSLPVIPDTYPSLHFMVERYSGYTGCDWFLGVYGAEEESLRMETPASTEGGCDEEGLEEQAATYADSLLNVTDYELVDDKLLLYTVENQLLLTMVPLDPLPFEGTIWELKFLATEPAYWQPHLPGTLLTAQFDGEQLSGNAGCNDYTATYTRSGEELVLGELSVTEKTCSEPEGVMDQESAYLSMLGTVGAIIESARTIELQTDDREPLLLYHGS
jgi:heat shock protein HslJ